ncbi:MAG: hypothetical protein Q7S02_05240, partial [bacterium]|nr:hypothetical protein [bacterium]
MPRCIRYAIGTIAIVAAMLVARPSHAANIALSCDEQIIKQHFTGYQFANFPMCPEAGKAYPGDLVVMRAGGFLPNLPNRTVIIGRIYFYKNDGREFVNWTYAMGQQRIDGNGEALLAFIVPVAHSMPSGAYTAVLRVFEQCDYCQGDRPAPRPCPPAECLQRVHENIVQAQEDFMILDPATNPRPQAQYGNGDFTLSCRWTETIWNEEHETYETIERYHRNARECAAGAEMTIDIGPFIPVKRSWTYHLHFRRTTDGKEFETKILTGGATCDHRMGKNGCVNRPESCLEPKGPRSNYDRNCTIAITTNIPAPAGSYQLALTSRWANSSADISAPDRVYIAGPALTVIPAPTYPQPRYKGALFTTTILRDARTLEPISGQPDLTGYLKSGQLIPSVLFHLPIRWNPPTGTRLMFPTHRMALVFDADAQGNGGTVLREGRVSVGNDANAANTVTLRNLQLPDGTTAGKHRLTVRCLECDTLTVPDPAIGNRARPVTYASASVDVQVADLNQLPLPQISVSPSVTAPKKKITIIGKNYPKNAIITMIEIIGSRSLSTKLLGNGPKEYQLTVDGYPPDSDGTSTLRAPVHADGTFALTLTLPKTAGDIVNSRGEVQVEVSVGIPTGTILRTTKMTIDASACPLLAVPTMTFTTAPVDFGRGMDVAVRGMG